MNNKFEQQSDSALVINWGRLVHQHNQIYEELEGYMSPDQRERHEIGLQQTSELIDLVEVVMRQRGMFDEKDMLKPEYKKLLVIS